MVTGSLGYGYIGQNVCQYIAVTVTEGTVLPCGYSDHSYCGYTDRE